MKKKSQPIKYISIKLPACSKFYPLDKSGCFKLPEYDVKYLKKHGKKLFDILMNKVPASILYELIDCLRQNKEI